MDDVLEGGPTVFYILSASIPTNCRCSSKMPPAALNAPYLHVPGTQAPLISAAIFSSAAAVGPTMIDHAGQSFDEMWAGFSDWLVEPRQCRSPCGSLHGRPRNS